MVIVNLILNSLLLISSLKHLYNNYVSIGLRRFSEVLEAIFKLAADMYLASQIKLHICIQQINNPHVSLLPKTDN